MFPDETAKWKMFPSMIDGIDNPFVFDKGYWKSKLYLTISEGGGDLSFGVVLDAIAYMAIDEALFSVADHSCISLSESPNCYIREATNSNLLKLYLDKEYLQQGNIRHFQFIGHDMCIECLCVGLPKIIMFANEMECDAWGPEI